jgi:hypothetical protein
MRAFNIREVVAGFEAAVMSAIRDEEHKNG